MKPSYKQLALAFGVLLGFSPARAQDIWTGNADNGQWAIGTNWSTGAEPTGNTEVNITATITLPSSATTISGYLNIQSAAVIIDGTNNPFTSNYLLVNNSGTLTLVMPASEVFTASSGLTSFIGDNTGSGVLNLTGSGTFSVLSSGDGLAVGLGSVGTVNQTNGTVNTQSGLWIGGDGNTSSPSENGLGGTGVYNISGTSTLTANFISVGLGSTTGGTTPTTGTLNIQGGVVNASLVVMGQNDSHPAEATGTISNTTGFINQTAGSLTASEVEIGENPGSADSYSLSGTGTYTGTVTVIGNLAGASGTFTQNGGTGTVATLDVGESGQGIYNLGSGTLTVSTGGGVTVGDQAGSSGTITQSGGLLTLAGTASLTVGNNGTGVYQQEGGTVTVNANGALNVGTGTGTGAYTLSSGTLNANGAFTVAGSGGTGVFSYNGGTLNAADGIFVESGGTFNQGTNFAPSVGEPVALFAGAIYNLNSGTLTIGGVMTTPGSSGITAFGSAIFNFAGGTVLPSGSDWYDGLNGSVTGNSTINTTNNNAILTGTLTGSGTLTVTGTLTVDLDTGGLGNSSAASWSVDVLGGTVDALATTFPSSGNITIGPSGTFDMNTAGTSTLTGTVSGAGAFDVVFGANTDTLKLASSVSLTGTTTFSGGGTLQTFNGSFGKITGTGNLVIGGSSGSGSVALNGVNNYTGSTIIKSGYTLTAAGIAGTGLVTNNGTLGLLGSTPAGSTFTTGGGLVSTGTLLIRMTGTSTDEFHIGTTGTLSGVVELINPAGSGTFTIVHTNASGDLTDNGLAIGNTGLLFQATLTDVNNQDIDLVTTSSTIAALPGLQLTPNEQNAADSIDAIIVNPSALSPNQQQNFTQLLLAIAPDGASNAQIAQNLEELTPQSLQYAQSIAYEHSAFLVSKVDSFDDALHHDFSGFDTSGVAITMPGFDSSLGHMMQPLLAFDPPSFHQTAPNGVNYYPGGESSTPSSAPIESPSSPEPSSQVISDSPTTAPMPMRTEPRSVVLRKPDSSFGVFVGGDGSVADLNQNSGAANAPSSKASYTSVDAIGGISYRMTSNLAAGILFDYSHTDADTDSYGSKTKVNSYSPGVFATYGDKGFYVNGLFAYGRNNYSNQRAVPVVNGVANSSPDGNQYTGALDTGYDFHLGRGWTLTPSAGLTYTHLDIDSFTETGAAPADLSIDAQHDDSLRSRFGGSVDYIASLGQITLLPTFSAMWQHEFLDQNAPITSQFSDFASSAFTVHSVSMGRDSALIGVGLTAELNNSMAIFINCMADVNGNYYAEDFIGGFKGSF